MKKNSTITIAVIVVLVGLMVWKLASNKQAINENKKLGQARELAIPVNYITTAFQKVDFDIIKTGALNPIKSSQIMVQSQGLVTQINFDLGTKVSEGQVIGRLDGRLVQLALEQSELALAKLEVDYERYKELYAGGGISEVNFKDVEFNYNNTKVQVEQARKQVANTSIKAPISGEIVMKNIEVGEFANPGAPLGQVVDVSELKVNVKVSESDAYLIEKGMTVKVTSPNFPQEVFEGKITFVSPQGDAAHNYSVEAVIPNKNKKLKAGTFVYVQFTKELNREEIIIPRSAFPQSVKTPVIYVVEGNKAVLKTITVGSEVGDGIIVLDGLKPGDQVIVNGQINLTNGTEIKPEELK